MEWKCTTSVSNDSRVLSEGNLQNQIKASLSKTDLTHSWEERMAPSMEEITPSAPTDKGTYFDLPSLHPTHSSTENSSCSDACNPRIWVNPALIVSRQEVPAQGPWLDLLISSPIPFSVLATV